MTVSTLLLRSFSLLWSVAVDRYFYGKVIGNHTVLDWCDPYFAVGFCSVELFKIQCPWRAILFVWCTCMALVSCLWYLYLRDMRTCNHKVLRLLLVRFWCGCTSVVACIISCIVSVYNLCNVVHNVRRIFLQGKFAFKWMLYACYMN